MPHLEPIPSDWLPEGLDLAAARIAGQDEVGRGSIAGPFLAAACVFPPGFVVPEGLRDSKALDPKGKRIVEIAAAIEAHCEIFSVWYGPAEIDELGIGKVNVEAHERLLAMSGADFTIVDGNFKVSSERPFRCAIKGERFAPVAAASVWAKVARDRVMAELALEYPGYGLESAGYGTPAAIAAVVARGRTPIHRRSFNLRGVDH